MVLLTGIAWTFTALSALAVPVGITFTEGVPLHYWGTGWAGTSFQYLHIISMAEESKAGAVNLAGANDILVKWDAPAGWLYVLNRPPANTRSPAAQSEAVSRPRYIDASSAHSPGSSLAGVGFVGLLLLGLKLRTGQRLPSVGRRVRSAQTSLFRDFRELGGDILWTIIMWGTRRSDRTALPHDARQTITWQFIRKPAPITTPSKPAPAMQQVWVDPRPPRRRRSRSKRAQKTICSSHRRRTNSISPKMPARP